MDTSHSTEVRMGFNEDLAILDDGNRGSSKHTAS